ncbi:Tetratricopeptide repeat [Phytophthora cactorum]|nr:Tetratricopeptide repeat [Phytophthora cactorum]
MASKRLDAVKLAKSSRWKSYGASWTRAGYGAAGGLPQSIGEGVLLALLKAFPMGARAPNTAEMLPLQIAYQGSGAYRVAAGAAGLKSPTGENAVQLARKAGLPNRSIKLLEEMYHHVCAKEGLPDQLAIEEQESKLQQESQQQQYEEEGQLRPSERRSTHPQRVSGVQYGQRQRRLSSTASLKLRSFSDNDFYAQQVNVTLGTPNVTPGPSPWSPRRATESSRPQSIKFGTFKKRHHCRNCGQSICRDHSARERMKLPHYGLSDRHRARQQQITVQAAQRGGQHTRISQARGGDARRSDESQRSPPSMLERHVSAPARASNSAAGLYRVGNDAAINEQVANLQKQVSQLMEEKQQAEMQLRVQAEMLNDPDRLTNGSRGSNTSGGSGAGSMPMSRDRQNSLPMQMHTGSVTTAPLNTDSDSDIAGRQTDIGDLHDAEADAEAEIDDVAKEYLIDDEDEDDDDEEAVVEAAKAANAVQDEVETEAESEDDVGSDTLPEVDVLVNLGHVMMEKGSVSAAVQAFTRAVEIRPDDPALHSLLGRAYYADENLEDAVASIAKSLELEPSATNSTLLGKILFEKGDHEKAIAAYQQSLDMQK